MKLVKGIVAAAMMTLACVGAASATTYYNSSTSLMLSAWNQPSVNTYSAQEIGMSLADTSAFQFGFGKYVQVGTIDTSLMTAGTYALSDLNVAIYGFNQIDTFSSTATIGGRTVMGTALFASPSATAPTFPTTTPFNFGNVEIGVASYYKSLDLANDGVVDGDTVVASVANASNYADVNPTYKLGVQSLSNIASSDLIMYLYAMDESAKGYVYLNGGNPISMVKITADGGVYMSTVPVPGAVWLLGSALLGAVGLRRKNA